MVFAVRLESATYSVSGNRSNQLSYANVCVSVFCSFEIMVRRPGFEPGTNALKGRCSTNWATGAICLFLRFSSLPRFFWLSSSYSITDTCRKSSLIDISISWKPKTPASGFPAQGFLCAFLVGRDYRYANPLAGRALSLPAGFCSLIVCVIIICLCPCSTPEGVISIFNCLYYTRRFQVLQANPKLFLFRHSTSVM